jgi:hypothetical protein
MSQIVNNANLLSTSHSASVEAWLDCGPYGRVMLSRVTPKAVVARTPHHIPPCYAELVVTVDGDPVRNRVRLPSGFNGRRVARAVNVEDVAPF